MNTRDSVFDEMSEESKLLYKFDAGYHGGRINLLKELLVAEIEKELLEELV
ncbi:MAG: hypothetical protein LLG05_10475 [Porphyromonadaceae bacterium]|nr:hypothetical protein [Porphyromonadaceae bacterium]